MHAECECDGEGQQCARFGLQFFLSRLGGGELTFLVTRSPPLFLSRLCGGEGGGNWDDGSHCFLSRLCGGEAEVERKADTGNVSKPPVRR